jgi:hypothetical protein
MPLLLLLPLPQLNAEEDAEDADAEDADAEDADAEDAGEAQGKLAFVPLKFAK